MKKLANLILLTALVLVCLLLLPTEAKAASVEDLTFALKGANSDRYFVSDCKESASGTLTVPATYNGLPVTGIDDRAFEYCRYLTYVDLPESVAYLGDRAFKDCEYLTGISMPGVTCIYYNAFYWCDNLTSVTISDDAWYIGGYAFCGCYNLKSITIPNSITHILEYAFAGCSSLRDVYYTGTQEQWDAIPISTGNGALTNATLHLVDTCTAYGHTAGEAVKENETDISYDSVVYCSVCSAEISRETVNEALTFTLNSDGENYSVTDCDTSVSGDLVIPATYNSLPVTGIGDWAFNRCTGLTSITIPDSVTSIDKFAFYYCTGLSGITIPDGVTSIGNSAFGFCNGLTSIIIPDSVTSIGDGAFLQCTGLTDITIPDGVTSIGAEAFTNCTGLESIVIPDGVTSIGDSMFRGCTNLTSITIPNSVTAIGDSAFYRCVWLEGVTIPDSVTTIGDYAFASCYNLTSITIPNSVTTIESNAFDGSNSLTGIYVDADNPNYSDINGVLFDKYKTTLLMAPGAISAYIVSDGVTNIGDNAFSGCTNLTSITIPDSVTTIGDSAFYDCNSLTDITIPDSVTTIGNNAFSWCEGLTCITIPDSVTLIGDSAFANCTSLISISISDSVITIGDEAFRLCEGLTSITIPGSVTAIGNNAFSWCKGLTGIYVDADNPNYSDINGVLFDKNKVTLLMAPGAISGAYTIPDGVTTIGSDAFFDCTGMTSITIPDSVTSVGDYAFLDCTSLTEVYYTGTQEQWDGISIGKENGDLTNATFYFVDSCADGHTYDESGNCACGATRATVTVADDEVIVNANGTTGIKIHVFNITGKEVADINVWNQLKTADPNFKTYTKSAFVLANGTYVLRIQYTDAEGVANVISDKITVDYTPEPVEGPAITVENNTVSVTNNGMSNVRVFAFNITGKEVADINVWNQLKAADPKVKTYTKSSFTLKNGDYVLRVQYTDAEGVTYTESHEVTVNVESVIPQATISGKSVAVDGKGTTVTKIHAFYVEGKEISDANNWNALKAADSAFKSYKNSQFSLRNIGAYVLRIEFVDQYGIAQTVSQLVSAK